MQFRRPSLLTVVFGLICLAVMIGLGFWQLDRREWKAELLAETAERLHRMPAPIPASPSSDWQFRPVTVEGSVEGGQWFRFPGRSRDGEVGDALMLLVRDDHGQLVAVEHGWVPFGAPLPPLPQALATEGILRAPPEPGWFTPNNDPTANAWYVADPAAMARAAGLPPGDAASLYVKPPDWRPHLPNDHLQYAITWFALAGVFVIIFVLFHRKKAKRA